MIMTDVIILSILFVALTTAVVLLKKQSDKVRKEMLDEMDELND